MNIGSGEVSTQEKRIGIFIIAYNAESKIEETLSRIPPDVYERVEVLYVVDDCSTDDTVQKAVELKKTYSKLDVIRNRVNRRYGGNQKFGYQYAIDHGLDVVVMLHADGQYAPEMLADIYTPLVNGEADVVFGSRMINRENALKGNMPPYKYYGNIIITNLQNMICRTKFSEYHSGYRAYSVALLENIPFWENTDEWHFDTEILLQATMADARIKEIPIPTYYGDEICHVNGMVYVSNCILTSLRYAGHRFGLLYSRLFDVNLKGKKYFSKFNDPYSSHSFILKRLLQMGLQDKKILELGVGDASLTGKMKEAGAIIDCVELDPSTASLAESSARRVLTGNIEKMDLQQLDTDYDVIIAADILEHLVRPEEILSKLKAYVKRGGTIIVSLPNVANIYVRMNLLLGRFPYHNKGILDKTHLHFYTLGSAGQLLAKTGWVIKQREVTAIPVGVVFPFLQKWPFKIFHIMLFGLTRLLKGLFAYQIILYAENPNEGSLL